jgi:hypothetical protein
MRLNLDFNPNSQPERKEWIFNKREIIILNRKYSCQTFLSQEEADEYIEKYPENEVLSIDSEGINVIPLGYDGIEVEFIPYEFKRYPIEPIDEKFIANKKRTSYVKRT